MEIRHGMPIWAPTDAEMLAFEGRIRAERAKVLRDIARYVGRKFSTVFKGERPSGKVHLGDAKVS